jgi:hypothetical protein
LAREQRERRDDRTHAERAGGLGHRRHGEAGVDEREAPAVAKFRAEHLYPRERRAAYRFGSVLFYRHDTWHRGTPLKPGAMRLAQNLTFRRAGSDWISTLHAGWAWSMYRRSRVMERLIAEASVEQRAVLGFPPPGHPYWTRETVAAIEARYGPLGFDVTPYASAVGSRRTAAEPRDG